MSRGQMMSKQSKFLEPLAAQVASGSSIKTSAEVVGCSIQTAYNLSATTEFKTRVASIRTEVASSTVGTLTLAASEAASALRELLDASNPPAVRLNSAKAVLASLSAISELGELRARIDALESKQ
jgi:hypothetical protein